ncbi:prolyl oligopeptidase family serine peptidase [Dyella sp. SG609]|uniref:alpha/beta hydrolase family protein n=1 Tax=Dyella sp. SG609 TaxID=2587018 RepID=UPI0014468633|nr:prolyl oligopeptidase family serine peptidase [Dyella sp. SG609]NKJ21505.1 dipeptidyl aminopeptidase/acylaminoacyl peptidase [Dyella sp. SG609]
MRKQPTSRRAAASLALVLLTLTAAARGDDTFRSRVTASERAAAAPLLPRDDFQTRTGVRAMRLAPDGRHLAWLWVQPERTSLWLLDTASGERRQALAAIQATSLDWSSDGRWLLIEQRSRIAALPLDGGEARLLAALDEARGQAFLGADPLLPARYLLRDKDPASHRFRLLRKRIDGADELLYEGDAAPTDVAFDRQGQARFIGTAGKGGRDLLQRRDGRWQLFQHCGALIRCTPLAVRDDGRLVMRGGDANLQQLVAIDPATHATQTLHADPEGIADLADALLDPRSAQVLLAAYDTDRHHVYAVDPALRAPVAWLDRRFANANLDLDVANNGLILVTERSDRLQRERYWLLDPRKLPGADALSGIAEDQQAPSRRLPESMLAQRIAVSWRASDGMRLYGFLSLPPGRDAAKLPLVLRPHGGPKAQTRPGYDMLTQFLVNRGYAVFEPNYRTSTGYGRAYLFAARGDYAHGRVYRDMLDGMDWLLAHGVGDAARQAITGHSYGGFATLLGLTYDSARFRVGMGMASPPDLALAFETIADNPVQDATVPVAEELAALHANDAATLARLREQAPARMPQRIAQPLVLIAGAKDERVPVRSVASYAASLKALGKPVSLLVDPDSGHQLEAPMARLATLYLLETALQGPLGGRADATRSAELQSYLQRNLRLDTMQSPGAAQ